MDSVRLYGNDINNNNSSSNGGYRRSSIHDTDMDNVEEGDSLLANTTAIAATGGGKGSSNRSYFNDEDTPKKKERKRWTDNGSYSNSEYITAMKEDEVFFRRLAKIIFIFVILSTSIYLILYLNQEGKGVRRPHKSRTPRPTIQGKGNLGSKTSPPNLLGMSASQGLEFRNILELNEPETQKSIFKRFQDYENLQEPFYLSDIVSEFPIAQENRLNLGVFDEKKDYSYIPMTCSPNHMVSVRGISTCDEGKEYTLPFTQKENKTFITCGGFDMFVGNCMTPAQGKYVYSTSNKEVKYNENPSRRWCSTDRNDYSVGEYDQETGYYKPKNCDLAIIHPLDVIKRFRNKLYLFIGDSHVRQVFYGLIAELRNHKIVVESHAAEDTKVYHQVFIRYEISENGDSLRDGFLASTIKDAESLKKCVTTTKQGECAVFVFFWSVRFFEQTNVVLNLIPILKPQTVFISSIGAHEAYPELPVEWKRAWERASLYYEKFIFLTFNKRYTDGLRMNQMKEWVNQSPIMQRIKDKIFLFHRECIHYNLFNFSPSQPCKVDDAREGVDFFISNLDIEKARKIRSGSEILQYQFTAHSICIAYDNWPTPGNVPYSLGKLPHFGTCEGWIDRAIIRMAYTFSIQ